MTVKDIETYVDLRVQELKSKSRPWLIVAAVAIVIIIILLVNVFRGKGKPNEDYEKQIRTMDSTLKYQQKTIDALQMVNANQDSTIEHLNEAYKNNRPIETRIIHEYEKIPNTVHDLSREQLRREVSNY
jgi:hypothetical protein